MSTDTDLPNQENQAATSWRHFIKRFSKYPLHAKWSTALGVLRFYLLHARKFETSVPVVIGKRVRIYRQKHGRIIVGRGVRITGDSALMCGTGREEAILSIGERTVIGPYARIMAATQVHIGARCMISWNCNIFDSTGHRMWLQGQDEAEIEAPITIGDDVWIGPYTIIMKGVEIGSNSIIGAGSVVRRSLPPNTLAYGNPARPVGKVDRWER